MSIRDELKERVRERGRDIRDEAANVFRDILREEAPVGSLASGGGLSLRSPGERLRDQVRTRPSDLGQDLLSVRAEVESEVASYVEEGTDPHPINPRNPGGVLVFFWPRVGKVVFLKHVDHPGTRPNPFFTRALERWPEALETAARRV